VPAKQFKYEENESEMNYEKRNENKRRSEMKDRGSAKSEMKITKQRITILLDVKNLMRKM
jgi:hypothetical protein